jgi:LysM repeat protein
MTRINELNERPTTRPSRSRSVASALAAVGIVVGAPAALLLACRARFGHLSPLHGMNAPWRWTADDARSWGRKLTGGIDTSAELVDLFLRIIVVAAWLCVAVLVWTIVAETIFQIRHGMPSYSRRRVVGLAPLGRRVATGLVAMLPLVSHAPPVLSGAAPSRAGAVPALTSTDLSSPATVQWSSSLSSSLDSSIITVTVQAGDSVWAIAEREAHGRDVDVLAQQIVERNIGRTMADGRTFTTPALILPGWQLEVPAAEGTAAPTQVPTGEVYVVEPGDSYWAIAEEQLGTRSSAAEVHEYTIDLIELNAPLLGYDDPAMIHPGDLVLLDAPGAHGTLEPPAQPPSEPPPDIPVVEAAPPPTAAPVAAPVITPAPTPPPAAASPAEGAATAGADSTAGDRGGVAMAMGLGSAAMLTAGALGVLRARRTQQLRRASANARLAEANPQVQLTEMLMRTFSQAELVARVDVALRAVAPELALAGARPLAVLASSDGELTFWLDRVAPSTDPTFTASDVVPKWVLPSFEPTEALAARSRELGQPCPAMVHLGRCGPRHLFVDLEAFGLLSIEADPAQATDIVRSITASLAVSPFLESSRLITVGQETSSHLSCVNAEHASSPVAALDAAVEALGSTIAVTRADVSTFELRTRSRGGEAWEPAVVTIAGHALDDAFCERALQLAGRGGRGLAVVTDRVVPGAPAVLRVAGSGFVLDPLNISVLPAGVEEADVVAVQQMLDAVDEPLPEHAELVPLIPLVAAVDEDPTPFEEQPHQVIIRTIGTVDVISATGESAQFERSKALELVAWLGHHREAPTRRRARTALWESDVRDATFANVVSDARRAMARVIAPPEGEEWIGRTMTEQLPLHPLVVTDSDLLRARLDYARGLAAVDIIEVLRPGVELITGMPFADTSYLWPDTEGTSSALTLLATSACTVLAQAYLAVADTDGVFWATGQGLKVLSGHEELIGLRMRAHAHAGDIAGVRREWESYERALLADSWSSGEPSPKLVALRRELLYSSLAG